MEKIVPMIHVPDVATTIAWYQAVGFAVVRTHEACEGEIDWALLSLGGSEVMFSAGGQPSTAERREIDLYVHAHGIDALHMRLKDRVEVVEEPHDTFYGMREFVIRDINRFWITFGQAVPA